MLGDYSIKKYGNHYAVYNVHTGEIIMHGDTWEECYHDLLEELGEER